MKQNTNAAQHGLWIGLLGLVVIFSGAIMTVTIPLENHLHRAIVGDMSELGHRRVDVDVNGRDVQLSGFVASERAGVELKKMIAGRRGVRDVSASFSIRPLRFSHLIINRSLDSVTVRGILGGKGQISMLQNLISDQQKLVLDVIPDAESSGANWLPAVPELLDATSNATMVRLELGAHTVIVSGIVRDDAIYKQIAVKIDEISDIYRLKLVNRLATADA